MKTYKIFSVTIFLLIVAVTGSQFYLTALKPANKNTDIDKNTYLLLKGNQNIIEISMREQLLNWGKTDNSARLKSYKNQIKANHNEIGKKLSEHEETKFNNTAKIVFHNQKIIIELFDFVGKDYDGVKKIYENASKAINQDLKTLEGMVK